MVQIVEETVALYEIACYDGFGKYCREGLYGGQKRKKEAHDLSMPCSQCKEKTYLQVLFSEEAIPTGKKTACRATLATAAGDG